ncbi:uncharacterized protein LOC131658675 [Vicia villosa]|uniref:uncharacterized protein LOC131658675 n=1 Tax=Vicia villosa TaxID=3911 RepID=UPI00273B44C9|nr:uncharacterized protein LOC131658675 [Vicia villosa]
MTRRKDKAVIQNSPAKKAAVKSPSKDSVKKKSTSAGPVKTRTKSIGVSPSNGRQELLKNMSLMLRLALERELAQNARDCKDIMELIEASGLIKTVVHLSKCYETLVKEFIVNLSEECSDKKSKEFRKVFVRGKCVNFSSTVINNLLGRSDEAQPELKLSDNKVCQVITANQVRSWPLKGKLSASKLSMKYTILHKIGAANWVPTNHKSIVSTVLGKFIYAVGTNAKFDYGTYIF